MGTTNVFEYKIISYCVCVCVHKVKDMIFVFLHPFLKDASNKISTQINTFLRFSLGIKKKLSFYCNEKVIILFVDLVGMCFFFFIENMN